MKVLVFTSSLRVGGAESMSVALANALAQAGVESHLAGADGALRGGVDARVRFHATFNPNHAPVHAAHTISVLLREIRADVVHSQGASCAAVAAVAREASKVRCARVLTHHSRHFRRAPRWIAGPIVRRCADHYVAISREKWSDLVALRIPPDKISLIPNFVDVEGVAGRVERIDRARVRRDLGIREGERVLIMAGRALRTRRFDTFVRIAAETARRLPEERIHALVVGDGPPVDDARKVAREEGVGAAIHFLGNPRDVYPGLAVADVVVFPSQHSDTLPMFLIEASALGRPIVCSDVPGNREVVRDGETGRVIDGDVGAYADAVVSLLEDPATARRLGEAAHADALARFDQRNATRATIAVYQGLLAAREPER